MNRHSQIVVPPTEVIPKKKQRVDYLKVRLQRLVLRLLREESRKRKRKDLLGFQRYEDMVFKVMWVVGLALCLLLFVYQTYDRIALYFTYPVTTDVFIIKKEYQAMPEITICYQESDRVFKLYEEISNNWCATIPVSPLLQGNIHPELIWTAINTTRTVISAVKKGGIKEFVYEQLDYTTVPLLYGACTTFRSKSKRPVASEGGAFEITLAVYPGYKCSSTTMSSVFVHEAGDYPQGRKLQTHAVGVDNHVGISVRQVNFLNRKGRICVATREHTRCIEECFVKFSMKEGRCRLPFHPPQVNLPPCLNSSRQVWLDMESFLTGHRMKDTCSCPPKCRHQTFDVKDTASKRYGNETKVLLEFDDSHETTIKERYIYDLIELLSNVGGISGLYIGISLLSLFEFIPILNLMDWRKKKSEFNHFDPLYHKVIKTYNLFNKFPEPLRHQMCEASITKNVLITLSIAFLGFAVVNRTVYYFTYPVRNVVHVSFNETLAATYPVLCPGDPRILDLQKSYAKKHNIMDSCQVKIWDLLDLNGINATYLWINPTLGNRGNWKQFKLVYLPDGTCLDFDSGELLKHYTNNIWLFSGYEAFCGTMHQKVYIKPSTNYYDYSLYRYIIKMHLHQLMYIIKEIKIEERDKACASEMENINCTQTCLLHKLWERITCRLPYMPDMNIPMCCTPNSAKHSHLTYWELFSLQSSVDDCNCLPPCRKRFYETRISAQDHLYLSFSYGASHNIIESYARVRSYTLIALFSDVGGWAGSVMGLCLLTLFDVVLSIASTALRRRKGYFSWVGKNTFFK